MRELALALTLTALILVTNACQERRAMPAATSEEPSPAPTPAIGVTFATLTPGPKPTSASDVIVDLDRSSATATATAEPVTYVVQTGDTLFDIAAAHGTTVNELLALNPGTQPELLMVGQQISLPPLPTLVSPAILATSTSTALEVEINGPTTYSSIGGGVWVLGEVQNVSSYTVELIQVEITLLDLDQTVLADEVVWLTPVTLPAGGKAPFGLLFSPFDGAPFSSKATIVAGQSTQELGNRYLDLAVSGAEVTIGRSPIEVEGRLENLGGQTAGQISIITTFYDEKGHVTGFHEERLDAVLAPGESVPFGFVALPPGGGADSCAFATQAVIVDSSAPLPEG